MWTNKQKITALYNLERVIEVLESTPVAKTFLKDAINSYDSGNKVKTLYNYLCETSLKDVTNEAYVYKYKLANQYALKVLIALLKNNPASQRFL